MPSPSSKKNIPYSLAMRIVRICTNPSNRENRFSELKNLLLERGYNERKIDSSIQKARLVPKEAALRKVKRKENSQGPVFAVTFDPRLPALGQIQARHWRSMTNRDTHLKNVFQRPPLIAFKRQQNIRGHLIRAQVAKAQRPYPQRKQKGMTNCGRSCTACPYIKQGKCIKINGIDWKINKQVNCSSYNIVYAICCKKEQCKEVYIGETKRMLKFRLDDHRGYVNNGVNKATGSHFNQPGHCLADLSVTILEQVKKYNDSYRKEREEYFIRKFNTLHKGMNRNY